MDMAAPRAVEVHNPLKGSVVDPVLLGNNYLQTSFTKQ